MTIGEIGKKKVITAQIDMPVLEVAKLMKIHNIGDVIVVDDRNKPLGIITDRDITIKIVAEEVSPNILSASDVMSFDLLLLKEYQSSQEALAMMCAKGVRRAPIVNDANILVGVISIDDLALFMSEQMENYGKLIRKQLSHD